MNSFNKRISKEAPLSRRQTSMQTGIEAGL